MKIFINKDPSKLELTSPTTPDDLETTFIFNEYSPVTVEIIGNWKEVKQLFGDIQFLADRVREGDFEKGSFRDLVLRRLGDQKLINI